ncbi:MAG: YqgE/AlgH family protein [Myxococcota bacterium]
MRTLGERLGNLLGLAAPVVLFFAWALDEPTPRPLVMPAASPSLPLLDAPCLGNVILADPELQDPNFSGTRILLCAHDENGALGVVLNRSLRRSPTELLGRGQWRTGPLHWGGPVHQGQGVGVYRREGELRFTTMHAGARFPDNGWLWPDRVRDDEWILFAVGLAGWNAGQLDDEVAAGVWILSNLEVEQALGRNADVDAEARAP